jgi:hypothetical protein
LRRIAYILKENADNIVKQLDGMTLKTEELLGESSKLQKDMKLRKIKDIKHFDEKIEKLMEQIMLKKAQLKREYIEAFNSEMDRVNKEQENFETHLSLIAFNKDTVLKTVQELD